MWFGWNQTGWWTKHGTLHIRPIYATSYTVAVATNGGTTWRHATWRTTRCGTESKVKMKILLAVSVFLLYHISICFARDCNWFTRESLQPQAMVKVKTKDFGENAECQMHENFVDTKSVYYSVLFGSRTY